MAEAPLVYRRLPGRSGGFSGSSSLWQGPDHLLLVNSSVIGERYRRFFFADIQAIIMRQTARRFVINVILLTLSAGTFSLVYFTGGNPAVSGTFVGCWLLFALVNSALGPTCETSIQTAVRTERIPSLVRLRKARKVLARIQPLIHEAQSAVEFARVS